MRFHTPYKFGLLALVVGCSLLNRDGPTKSCAELAGGTACHDGIIASCPDGQNLKYVVCDDREACEAAWQTGDQFRCEQGDVAPSPSSTSTSSSSGTTSTSSSGTGGIQAVAICGDCPTGYHLIADVPNDECGDGACGTYRQSVCLPDGVTGFTQGGIGQASCDNTCPPGTTPDLVVPDCFCGTTRVCITN